MMDYKVFKESLDFIEPFLNKKTMINLVGAGEPLLNKDIVKMISLAKEKGLRVNITTNSLLLTKSLSKRILRTKCDFVTLSLESKVEHINDSLRGVPGHYKKVMNAIKYLSGANPSQTKLGIVTTVSRLNLFTIPELVEFVETNSAIAGIRLQAVTSIFGVDTNKMDIRHSDLWPTNSNQVIEVYDKLIQMKKSYKKLQNPVKSLLNHKKYFLNFAHPEGLSICDLDNSISILPDGKMCICPMIDYEDSPFYRVEHFDIKSFNNKKFDIYLREAQPKIRMCNSDKCHVMLNCKLEYVE